VISIDTNILLPAVETKNAHHVKAAAFLESITARDDVAISELALFVGILPGKSSVSRATAAPSMTPTGRGSPRGASRAGGPTTIAWLSP